MKKYLMTGVAAVAMCAAFTSCSKNEDLYDPGAVEEMEIASVYEQYNQAFIKTFGQVNPNQDWGFGSNFGKVGTRGVFANGNEWAANDRDDCKYKVPPVLTEAQKNIVRIYFQSVKNPDYQDPQWTDYFIQQVYKGGDSPMSGTNPAYNEPYSAEKYKAADGGTYIVGSDHMDHLAAINGDFVDHNNNFNHGDCGEYGNVLDYVKATATTPEVTYPVNDATHRHADKINLMTNSTTASFGYYNSNSSVRRTEYTGLVSWSTIKTWADANGYAGQADCLDDGWNRSFMGFDFEMMVGDEIYAYEVDYSRYTAPENQQEGVRYINNFPVTGDKWYEFNGVKYHMLNSNQNMYCGTFYKKANGEDLSDSDINDELIASLLEQGYLPVDGGANKKWVKVGGTADGYRSDWIVTLTKAEKYTTTPPPSGYDVRIMAEDLNATAADGDIENSDWDCNYVVFDVKYNAAGTGATIKLVAAGGVLKLTVAGHEVHEAFGEQFDAAKGEYPMINTGKGPNHDPVTFEIQSGLTRSENGKDIPIIVYKKLKDGTEKPFTLDATKGAPAAKFAVKPSVNYLGERVHIDFGSNGAFARGVQNGNYIWW